MRAFELRSAVMSWVISLSFLAISGSAVGQTWDGWIEVPAAKLAEGRWITCQPGQELPPLPTQAGASKYCVRTSGLQTVWAEKAGRVVEVDLQGLLDMHMSQRNKATAVGPLPVTLYRGPGHGVAVDYRHILVAYKSLPIDK